MTGVSKALRRQRAYDLVSALAARYRVLAEELIAAAERLDGTPLDDLVRTPVKHMHSSARRQEEALDEALMAL